MLDIKQIIFQAIGTLSIPVRDNPQIYSKKFPFGILRTINVAPQQLKNYTKAKWLVRLDVFSDYKGEKELLDYYNNEIVPKVKEIQQVDGITYITSTCSIMDDKEQGPVIKHAVISFIVDTMEV